MTRHIAALAAAAATVSLAACGSSDAGPDAAVEADAAKTRIEQAAHVKLAAETVPADAREQGLQASYSNAATAVEDMQVVGLFVVEDAGLADEVAAQVRRSAPKAARPIVDGNIMVVYAAAGDDRFAAVETAVKSL